MFFWLSVVNIMSRDERCIGGCRCVMQLYIMDIHDINVKREANHIQIENSNDFKKKIFKKYSGNYEISI